MDAVEAVTEDGVIALQAVHCGGTEGHKQGLFGETDRRGWTRLREGLEAPSDQNGAAAAVLQLEGLGGLDRTYKAPLCIKETWLLSFSAVQCHYSTCIK